MEISETNLASVLEALPGWQKSLTELREIVLANAVMCGEIPSPTFEEDELVRFLCDRFTEAGLNNISTDEFGNAASILPGTEGKHRLLLVAHVDKIWAKTDDHTVTVGADTLTGRGIADNGLGVAVLASLPTILEHLGIELESDLVLLGSTRGFGKGDLGGIRFFLENSKVDFDAALCLEGMQLERLSYSCLGMLRGEIQVSLKSASSRHSPGPAGAIAPLNHIVERILAIERPEKPITQIRLGSVQAGSAAYNVAPRSGSLRFEIRSEDGDIVSRITDQINEITDEISAGHEASAKLQVIARREPGDIGFSHPLVKSTRQIMETLGLQPALDPSMSELAALLDQGIPALTIGLTRGENRHTPQESIEIDPLYTGLAQLIAVLVLLDQSLSTPDE